MDSIFESALLSAWFLISEIVTPWPSRIEVPKEWMGNVGGFGDIDNGDLRGDSVGLNKLNVPPRKHGEAGLWMRRWARDPFPSDDRKISSASGASKWYQRYFRTICDGRHDTRIMLSVPIPYREGSP